MKRNLLFLCVLFLFVGCSKETISLYDGDPNSMNRVIRLGDYPLPDLYVIDDYDIYLIPDSQLLTLAHSFFNMSSEAVVTNVESEDFWPVFIDLMPLFVSSDFLDSLISNYQSLEVPTVALSIVSDENSVLVTFPYYTDADPFFFFKKRGVINEDFFKLSQCANETQLMESTTKLEAIDEIFNWGVQSIDGLNKKDVLSMYTLAYNTFFPNITHFFDIDCAHFYNNETYEYMDVEKLDSLLFPNDTTISSFARVLTKMICKDVVDSLTYRWLTDPSSRGTCPDFYSQLHAFLNVEDLLLQLNSISNEVNGQVFVPLATGLNYLNGHQVSVSMLNGDISAAISDLFENNQVSVVYVHGQWGIVYGVNVMSNCVDYYVRYLIYDDGHSMFGNDYVDDYALTSNDAVYFTVNIQQLEDWTY